MENIKMSDSMLDEVIAQYEQQMRSSAADTQLRANFLEQLEGQMKSGGVPDFPPAPNIFKAAEILGRYAVEAIRHLPDSGIIVRGLIGLATTKEGQKLLARLKDAIVNHKYDPTLFKEIMQELGGGAAGYGSLTFGLVAEAHAGSGIVGVTGIALPTKGDGKAKWFSGLEKSAGPIADASVNLVIGQKIKEPEKLTGQFYGAHTSIEVELALGSSIYFDTSNKLEYEGFSTTLGVGIGGGLAVLSGWELVIPG